MATSETVTAEDGYDRLAPAYACLTAGYDHERWLTGLVGLARGNGLEGRTVLDVACGTGATLEQLSEHGFEATGVDRSQGMLAVAERRLGTRVRTARWDMRELPRLGAFDLVTCLDDALNHLLEPDDVAAAVRGMARNLRPGGLLVVDLNTLSTLRTVFSSDSVATDDAFVVVWRGLGSPTLQAGGRTAAELIVVALGGVDAGPPERLIVQERHHPPECVLGAARSAGLEPLAVVGTRAGGILDERAADESAHHKLVIVARKRQDVSIVPGTRRGERG